MHSPGPGEALGLIQCHCDCGSACPMTKLPLLLFSTVGSYQTWREWQSTTSPPSRPQLSFMHTVCLSATGEYGAASRTPQVSQCLTNLDTVARGRTVECCSPFSSMPCHPLSPSGRVVAGLTWGCDFHNSSRPYPTTTLLCLFCGNLRFCFPLLGRLGTASTRGGDMSQEDRQKSRFGRSLDPGKIRLSDWWLSGFSDTFEVRQQHLNPSPSRPQCSPPRPGWQSWILRSPIR